MLGTIFLFWWTVAQCAQAALLNGKAPYQGRASKRSHVLDDETSKFIEDTISHFHVPSLSVALLNGNETLLDSFGHAILGGDEAVPATPDTLYYVGSLTKSFTAASLLHTLQEHSFSLDTKLAMLLPDDFVLPDEYSTTHATVADALTHRLGMPRCEMSYGGEGFSVRDAVRLLRHLPQGAELRERYQYNNMGYAVLQHVIESLSGLWIGDVHKEALWTPLAMKRTAVKLGNAATMGGLAEGYSFDWDTNKTSRQPWVDERSIDGAGSIISSVRDMAKWLRWFMEGRAPPELTAPLILTGPGTGPFPRSGFQLYAMGWAVTTYRGETVVMHSGGIGGFRSWMAYIPGRWGCVLLTNGDTGAEYAVAAILVRLLDELMGASKQDRDDMIKFGDDRIDVMRREYAATRDTLFPPDSIPNPPVPRTAGPLENYAGVYWNDGFRALELGVSGDVLHGDWRRTHNITLDLEWVSGEHFILWMDTAPSTMSTRMGVPAEFRVGVDGRVSEVGFAAEPSLLEKDEMVWFRRVEEEVEGMPEVI